MRVYTITPKKRVSIFSRINMNLFLVGTNVAVYILYLILSAFDILPIEFIAISPGNIFAGKYLWTFITSMFMHGGFAHLFVNMISLFFVGGLTQKLIGPKRYFYFYMGSGIFASLLYVFSAFVIPSQMNTFAVGASGAIFGLLGFLMIIVPNLQVLVMFIIPVKMKYAAPGMLVMLWVISLAGNVPIGNMAHLGGFLVGIGYGLYLKNKYKNKTRIISKRFS